MTRRALLLALALVPTLLVGAVLRTYHDPVPAAEAAVPEPPEMRPPQVMVRNGILYVTNWNAEQLASCVLLLFRSRGQWTWLVELPDIEPHRTVASDRMKFYHWTGRDAERDLTAIRGWTMRCVGITAKGTFPRQDRRPVKIAMGPAEGES